jgi:hypothetical protein
LSCIPFRSIFTVNKNAGKMKKTFLLFALFLPIVTIVAQSVAINTDGAAAHTSAALDIKSTDKGMLVPRMTTAQRTAISNPATGLLIFDTTTGSFWFYNGSSWANLVDSNTGTSVWAANGSDIYNTNAANVGIGTTTPNANALLHLNSTSKGMLLPTLSNDQMTSISSPPVGLMVFNANTKSPMIYTQRGYQSILPGIFGTQNAWTPISPGPRIIAWGVVDSLLAGGGATPPDNTTHAIGVKSGSNNFSVIWNGPSRWVEITLTNMDYKTDSMILLVTPIGNETWDQAVSTSHTSSGVGTQSRATIKFTDISRSILGYPGSSIRRRSKFSFILYSLTRDSY